MTEQWFIDNVETLEDIIQICVDTGCDICNDIFSESDRDDYIIRNIDSLVQNAWSWQGIRDELSVIPEGDDYYEYIDGDWVAVDEERVKDLCESLYNFMKNHELFDNEETEEVVDALEDEYDQIPLEDEDISIYELFTICNDQYKSIEIHDKHVETYVINGSNITYTEINW